MTDISVEVERAKYETMSVAMRIAAATCAEFPDIRGCDLEDVFAAMADAADAQIEERFGGVAE